MAATAPPEIQVYASFPRADLNIDPTNWRWVHCITFPIETLNAPQFSQRPYKWIRYTIGVVLGAEGDLSSSPDSPNVVDYHAGLPAESAVLYYHISDQERRRMFPVDPDIGHTELTSSIATTRRGQFYDDVAERDGRVCVMTGMAQQYCDAAHLLGHSKGGPYIATYTQRRCRDPAGINVVQDIDSVRNGLFLNKLSHVGLGTDFAFLITPNFAMTTADVDPTAPPTEKRCVAHTFQPDSPALVGLPPGSPLRISDWPPTILFDAVYASVVLRQFGTRTLLDEVTRAWKDISYPTGVTTVPDADHKATTDKRAVSRAKAQERKARDEALRGPDTFDMLMTLPYIMVPRDELQATLREPKEKAEATEKRRVQEKVETWIKQITPE